MAGLSKAQAASREKTLLVSFLLSLPGPLLTGLAVASSQSTTQLADFIRRSVELAAMFLSWWVFQRLHRGAVQTDEQRAGLERAAGLAVAGAMICSGAVMLGLTLALTQKRLPAYAPGGRVTLGLVIAVLGLLANAWFWQRYARLTREQYSPVIAAQQVLYRAKASVDLCVVTALAAVAIAPAHAVTRWIDILGSLIVALYLLWSGLRLGRSHIYRTRP